MEISYYLLRNISLDKISIELCEDVEVESLIEFVRQTQNMKKNIFKRFQYYNYKSIEDKTRALQEIFGRVWKITSTGDGIYLERHLYIYSDASTNK